SETFRGNSPFSEPETEAIKNLFLKNSFQAAVSYHSYSQLILYPWGFMDQPTEQEELLSQLARQMAELIYQVNGRIYEVGRAASLLYLTNGDLADWVYGFFQIPVFTIELPPLDILHGGFINSEQDINDVFLENWPAALFLIDWAISSFEPKKKGQRIWPEKRLEKLPGFVVKDRRSLF
ncbi:MAG: M14 family zinc carboxypeptidase, partial [Candidatus Saccharicenans sp.]